MATKAKTKQPSSAQLRARRKFAAAAKARAKAARAAKKAATPKKRGAVKAPSAAQLRARKKFAAAAKARAKAARAGKRNATNIRALKIDHLDVSKVHNPRRGMRAIAGQARRFTKHAELVPETAKTVIEARDHDKNFGLKALRGKRKYLQRKNAEHRDAQHPIHVTDYWQGRKGYKSQWQRAHDAGQRQLFGVKNPRPLSPEMSSLAQAATLLHAQGLTKNQVIAKLRSFGASQAHAKTAYMHSQSAIRAAVKSGFILPARDLGRRITSHGTKRNASARNGRLMYGGYSEKAKGGYKWVVFSFTGGAGTEKLLASGFTKTREAANAAYKLALDKYRKNGKRVVSRATRSNGTALARKRRAEFVGRPSKKTISTYAPKGSGAKPHSTLVAMGKLKKVYIKGRTPLNFNGAAILAHDPKTDKMFVLGREYTLKHLKKNPDGFEDLGEVTRIEYETTKTHLGDETPVTYFHKLGEEGGEKPHAVINEENLLLIEGGDYYITPEGIRD